MAYPHLIRYQPTADSSCLASLARRNDKVHGAAVAPAIFHTSNVHLTLLSFSQYNTIAI
jgi:hypothetical protein